MEIAIMGGSWEVSIVQPSVIGLYFPWESLAMAIATCSGYFLAIAFPNSV